MEMRRPYKDKLPTSGQKIMNIPIKFVESSKSSSVFIINQEWVELGFPDGSKLSMINNMPAVYVPPNQVMPMHFQGQPVIIGKKIYEKREDSYWKKNT